MDTFLKLDIFFFITSVAVIIVTTVIVMAGYRLIKILKNIEHVTETLKNTVHSAESEMADIGERITESTLFNFVFGKRKIKVKRETKKSKED
jgi:hypothetical protein